MSDSSFYKILGVSEKASRDEIKKAYRTLSLKHHPDRNKNNPESSSIFQKINEAYETLGDEQKRNEYDMMQKNPFMKMSHEGGMEVPIDEIFNAFFGGDGGMPFGPFGSFGGPFGSNIKMGGIPGAKIHVFSSNGGGGFHRALQKPTPIIKNVTITMEQVLNGANIPVDIERWIVENGNKVFEHETLYVNIPKGIDDNEIIMLREKGNIIDENIKGDVKIFIKVHNDTEFERHGLDLIMHKTISLKDALCGFKFEIKYVNGKNYTLNCNTGNIIHPEYKKILPEMGLKREGHTGNLIIVFNVEFPKLLNAEQITKLKEIL